MVPPCLAHLAHVAGRLYISTMSGTTMVLEPSAEGLKVLAENNLDALVYVYTTIPPHIILTNRLAKTVETHTEPRVLKAGTVISDSTLVSGEPVLQSDLDTYRGSGSSFAVSCVQLTGIDTVARGLARAENLGIHQPRVDARSEARG